MAASTTNTLKEIAASDNLRGGARTVWGFLSTKWKNRKQGRSTSGKRCRAYMKSRSSTSKLQEHLHLTFHAEESQEAQLAVAKADTDVRLWRGPDRVGIYCYQRC